MARYHYFRLAHCGDYVDLFTTDEAIIDTILEKLKSSIPRLDVRKFYKGNARIFKLEGDGLRYWLFSWLLENEWEPYAASSSASEAEAHHFRKLV